MWSGAGLVVLAGALVTPAASAGPSECDEFEPVEVGGPVAEPRLIELSGLAASPGHSDVLWAHNDSGGAAELYAFAEDGTSLGAYPVEGAEAVDWEDMAAGPAPNGSDSVLYIGDIGDNDAARPTVTVYRVYEPGEIPAEPGVPLTEVEAIELEYPDGPSDAEALLVDPRSGDLVIVTKSLLGRSRVLSVPAASLVPGAPVPMVDEGGLQVPLPPEPGSGFPGTAVTGGDVSPDGSMVLLRTYRSVLAFARRGPDARRGPGRAAVLRPSGGGAAGRGDRVHRRRPRLRHGQRRGEPDDQPGRAVRAAGDHDHSGSADDRRRRR